MKADEEIRAELIKKGVIKPGAVPTYSKVCRVCGDTFELCVGWTLDICGKKHK